MQEMTSLERSLKFVRDVPVDRVLFNPLVMQIAARYAGIPYRGYCLDHEKKADASLKTEEDFGIDWVHVGGRSYTDEEDNGLVVEYPENSLPLANNHLITDPGSFRNVRPLDVESCRGMMGRVKGVRHMVERADDYLSICVWTEGPIAESTDPQGMTDGCMDLILYPNEIKEMLAVKTERTKNWLTLQAQAGARLPGIGDAACSQIWPKLFREFVFEHHKELVEQIHSLGATLAFQICRDTNPNFPMLIETDANKIDIDHLVGNVEPFVDFPGSEQVLRGTCDPMQMIEEGPPEQAKSAVLETHAKRHGKCMGAAGWEIPLDTRYANLHAMRAAAASLTFTSDKRIPTDPKPSEKITNTADETKVLPIPSYQEELSEDEKDDLLDAIIDGDIDEVVKYIIRSRDAGEDLDALLKSTMIPAITKVEYLFSDEKNSVPEMLVADRAMQSGIDIIEPILAEPEHESVTRICVGCVKGDIHDIGRNLVVMMLRRVGFDVLDLDENVSVGKFEDAVKDGCQAVCLLALLTETKPEVQNVVNHFRASEVDAKFIIDGAVVSQGCADAIGADGYSEDALGAVRVVKKASALVN